MILGLPDALVFASAVTCAAASLAYGIILKNITPAPQRALIAALVLVQLPMCWLALDHVRVPCEHWLEPRVHPDMLRWLRSVSAPLGEELAKAWPLVVLAATGRLRGAPPVAIGMALGLGFGLGEVWTVAGLLAPRGDAIGPWWTLGGFMTERFFVCLCHAAFTSVCVYGAVHGRALSGLAAAMGLHFLGNLPLFVLPLLVSRAVGSYLLQAWFLGFFGVMAAILVRLHTGGWAVGRVLMGDATCPTCRVTYGRPLFGLNAGTVRYERCPACRTWNWT